MLFKKVNLEDFYRIRQFYWDLIDEMSDQNDKIGWKKGIYPTDSFLQESLERGELFVPHALAVSPSGQGKGIGRYFMGEILKLAKAEKKKAVRLISWAPIQRQRGFIKDVDFILSRQKTCFMRTLAGRNTKCMNGSCKGFLT